MKAKKKPMEKKKVSDFEFDVKNRLKTLKVTGMYYSYPGCDAQIMVF